MPTSISPSTAAPGLALDQILWHSDGDMRLLPKLQQRWGERLGRDREPDDFMCMGREAHRQGGQKGSRHPMTRRLMHRAATPTDKAAHK
jgi:hypothetical protein